MLEDSARKLLRILNNFSSQHRRMPTWNELAPKMAAVNDRNKLIKLLEILEQNQYITWEQDDPTTIRIIKFETIPTKKEDHRGSDYFMNY